MKKMVAIIACLSVSMCSAMYQDSGTYVEVGGKIIMVPRSPHGSPAKEKNPNKQSVQNSNKSKVVVVRK